MANKITFGRLTDVINNVLSIDETKIFINVISEETTKELILHLNRIEQLFKEGVDSDGKIAGVYSEFTEFINEGEVFTFEGESKQKIAGEPYMLFDSGFFFNSFRVRIYKEGYFTITANDETEDGTELARKFGKKILGLTTESKNELIKEITPGVRKEFKREILRGR